MKITFLCNSLEPGRDGVGDYTRRLAGELIRKNHKVNLVALKDKYIIEMFEGIQTDGNSKIPVLRLPSKWTTKRNGIKAKNKIEQFQPDWISLQFVNFGFHKFGLPLGLIFFIRQSIGKAKLHIMFHELWCGNSQYANRKEKILGFLQRMFIKRVLLSLNPQKVFTNTQSSAKKLKEFGVNAILVPVFSNIPLNDYGSSKEWEKLISNSSIFSKHSANNCLTLGFFGTVYSSPGLQELLQCAVEASRKMGRWLCIFSFGHLRGIDIKPIVQKVEGISFWQTGELPLAMINRIMLLIDLGVVTTSADGLSKSGTAISWLERGIPILISSNDHSYQKAELEFQGVYQVKEWKDIIRGFEAKNNLPIKNHLEETTSTYSELLR
jgi:glycosyltransferase involved in cell wall biosynthesis